MHVTLPKLLFHNTITRALEFFKIRAKIKSFIIIPKKKIRAKFTIIITADIY